MGRDHAHAPGGGQVTGCPAARLPGDRRPGGRRPRGWPPGLRRRPAAGRHAGRDGAAAVASQGWTENNDPMDAIDCLRRMAHNNAWASLRLHRAIGQLGEEEYRAQRTSFFPSLHLTLVHILFVDIYYVDALEAVAGDREALWAECERFEREEGFAAVHAGQREVDQRLVRFTGALQSEGDLDRPVRLQRKDHVQVERCGDVLLHLFEHQIHHRGQAHAMLAGTRIAPPQLDEFFLAEELPLRRAELEELGLPLR